jgi:hypothetical protein
VKTRSQSESAESSHAAQRAAAALHAGGSGATAAARQLQASPRLTAQRRSLDAMFGAPAQRMSPEEEMPAQGRFATAQLEGGLEEELPAQGRFETAPSPTVQAKEDGAAGAAPNRTGMPDGLKSGIEALSGMDLSDVRVHRNSSEPAQLNALAYAQGNDVHLAPGQEQHLPHEAWHVVQQRQGRVAPTMQMQGVAINDDAGLEQEADVMGAKALQTKV